MLARHSSEALPATASAAKTRASARAHEWTTMVANIDLITPDPLEARVALALTLGAFAVAAAREWAEMRQSTPTIIARIANIAQTAIAVTVAVTRAEARACGLNTGARGSAVATIADARVCDTAAVAATACA